MKQTEARGTTESEAVKGGDDEWDAIMLSGRKGRRKGGGMARRVKEYGNFRCCGRGGGEEGKEEESMKKEMRNERTAGGDRLGKAKPFLSGHLKLPAERREAGRHTERGGKGEEEANRGKKTTERDERT